MHYLDEIAAIIDRELPTLTDRERRQFFRDAHQLLNDREEEDAEPDAFGIAKEHSLIP